MNFIACVCVKEFVEKLNLSLLIIYIASLKIGSLTFITFADVVKLKKVKNQNWIQCILSTDIGREQDPAPALSPAYLPT